MQKQVGLIQQQNAGLQKQAFLIGQVTEQKVKGVSRSDLPQEINKAIIASRDKVGDLSLQQANVENNIP